MQGLSGYYIGTWSLKDVSGCFAEGFRSIRYVGLLAGAWGF